MFRIPVKTALVAVFFILLSLAVYHPTLDFPFFQDDFTWLEHAAITQQNPGHIFTLAISNFFMPAVHAYFALMHWLVGIHNPAAFHLVNIILHGIVSALVALLAARWLKNRWLGLTAGIFFLLLRYPFEAVVWVSAVTVLLYTAAILATVLAYDYSLTARGAARTRWLLLAAFLTLITFTIKEMAVTLPFLLALAAAVRHRQGHSFERRDKFFFLFLILLLAGYGTTEYFLQREGRLVSEGAYRFGFGGIRVLLVQIAALTVPVMRWLKANEFLVALFGAGVVTSGVFIWMFGRRLKHSAVALAGGTWMIIAFLPTSFFTDAAFVSRYAYLPAVGFVLLVTALLDSLRRIKPFAFAILTFYLATNVALTRNTLSNFYQPYAYNVKNFTAAVEAQQHLLGAAANEPRRLVFTGALPIHGVHLRSYLRRYTAIYTNRLTDTVDYPDLNIRTDDIIVTWNGNNLIIKK